MLCHRFTSHNIRISTTYIQKHVLTSFKSTEILSLQTTITFTDHTPICLQYNKCYEMIKYLNETNVIGFLGDNKIQNCRSKQEYCKYIGTSLYPQPVLHTHARLVACGRHNNILSIYNRSGYVKFRNHRNHKASENRMHLYRFMYIHFSIDCPDINFHFMPNKFLFKAKKSISYYVTLSNNYGHLLYRYIIITLDFVPTYNNNNNISTLVLPYIIIKHKLNVCCFFFFCNTRGL